jgi:hypothetical protein
MILSFLLVGLNSEAGCWGIPGPLIVVVMADSLLIGRIGIEENKVESFFCRHKGVCRDLKRMRITF